MIRRTVLRLAAIAVVVPIALPASLGGAEPAAADEAGWAALRQPGAVALIRHARAPGTGDPPGFRLGDCVTQRNLSGEGREQARRLGEAVRARGVRVDRVLTSEWCRARDTATLAFGTAEPFPALNSFFADRTDEPAQSDRVRRSIAAADAAAGALVMVTHQVNITALTGVVPREGEIVVVRNVDGKVAVQGRIVVAD